MPFMHELLTEKILDFLVEHAQIKTVAAEAAQAAEAGPKAGDNPENPEKEA